MDPPVPFSGSAFLSDEEIVALSRNLLDARGEEGATEDELMAVVDWAYQTRVTAQMLEMALDGELRVCVVDGEVKFEVPEA